MSAPRPARVEADWLRDPAAQAVAAALEAGGAQALFVGGCVRNALLEALGVAAPATDVDLATDARPERTVELVEAAGLKAVPTGIDHGTVTAVAGGRPFEITTFRADVETDGRRAVVAYSDDVATDAARRDFTMNALYARADGTLVDPLGGLADLRARRVRFIGDAAQRIREDYLRILRFFRFHAWYGLGDPDAAGIAACAASLDGLDGLSRERVGHEMRRLLGAPSPAGAVSAMAACGALARVLPGAEAAALPPLEAAERAAGAAPDWRRRMAALHPDEDAAALTRRLRLSNADGRRLAAIEAALRARLPAAAAAYRHGAEAARDAILVRAAAEGFAPPPDLAAEAARGAAARMPVTARDLIARGVPPGPELGRRLAELEDRWIAADFALDRDALLAEAPG